MKTIFKFLVTVLVAILTPVAAFILVSLIDVSLFDTFETLSDLFIYLFGWTMLCGMFGIPIVLAHIILFGVPAFLLGWHFRAIRWWTTLITAFIIGVAPTAAYVFIWGLERPFEGPLGLYLGLYSLGLVTIQAILDFESVTSVVLIMGLLGVSAGLVYWILWRYWVFPTSPYGRAIIILNSSETPGGNAKSA